MMKDPCRLMHILRLGILESLGFKKKIGIEHKYSVDQAKVIRFKGRTSHRENIPLCA